MKTRKFASVMVLALWLGGCNIQDKCTIGDDSGCPSDSVCYGGENAKAGGEGICVALSPVGVSPPGTGQPAPQKEERNRLLCSAQTENLSADAVQAPLAISGEKLLFGTSVGDTEANSSLYVFDTAACVLLGHLHTGALQGPMVPFGNGHVALAVGAGGPPKRDRAALVLADVEKVDFVYDNPERDCGVDTVGGPSETMVFNKGLALAGIGSANEPEDWLFAAPGNRIVPKAAVHILTYGPYAPIRSYLPTQPEERRLAKRCYYEGRLNYTDTEDRVYPILLTPIQGSQKTDEEGLPPFMAIHQADSSRWVFFPMCPTASCGGSGIEWQRWYTPNPTTVFENPSGLAGGGLHQGAEQVWLSGDGLYRLRWSGDTERVLSARLRTSPAAVNNEGRLYVVVRQGGGGYKLQQFRKEIFKEAEEAVACVVDDTASPCWVWQVCVGDDSQAPGSPGMCEGAPEASTSAFWEAPVGSPILGEPIGDGPAEVYVVTTAGTVLAFRADTLELLWTQNLDVHVSATAQPVLAGDMLWVVGSGGEVYGMQVDSDGLSREALWPKAFRDNCNTSSFLSTPDTLPNCFMPPSLPVPRD